MRIIKVDSNNWSNEINEIEKNVITNISNDIVSLFNKTDGYIKHDKYKIYKDRTVLDGLKVTFVFTIHSNILKNETFIYTLYTNTQTDFYTLEINLNKDKKNFKTDDYKKVKDYILNDLKNKSSFNKNSLLTKFLNKDNIKNVVSSNILACF